MSNYQIKGTVSLFMEKGQPMKVCLTPANGYLCPDNKYAVFFPVIVIGGKSEALMKEIKDKVIELELLPADDIKNLLLFAAGSQKSIRLEVEETPNEEKTLKVIGFTYPIS